MVLSKSPNMVNCVNPSLELNRLKSSFLDISKIFQGGAQGELISLKTTNFSIPFIEISLGSLFIRAAK